MTKSRGLLRPRHQWTGFELDALRRLYPDTTARCIADVLGIALHVVYKKAQELKLEKSAAFLASPASGRLDGVRGSATRWGGDRKPPRTPKGVRMSPGTEFKAGQRPANWQPVGALRINSMGDLDIKVVDGPNGWVALRRYVWESEFGPIPPGMVVGVRNGDPHDTQPHNLVLTTRTGHLERHLLKKYPKELRNAMALQGRLKNRIKALEGAQHG